MPHCALMSMGTPLFYFKIEVIIRQIFSRQSMNKNLFPVYLRRNDLKLYLGHIASQFPTKHTENDTFSMRFFTFQSPSTRIRRSRIYTRPILPRNYKIIPGMDTLPAVAMEQEVR